MDRSGVFRLGESTSAVSLRQFSSSAREIAEKKGLRLLVDIDDFQRTDLESNGPLCSEPWETIYILNRGIMPCCFGKKPLATLEGVVRDKLDEYVAQVFNGEAYQTLRKGLAAKKLPKYCQESNSCPIVNKVISENNTLGFSEKKRN